jgi:DNA-binding MarR family transcriptional regulator
MTNEIASGGEIAIAESLAGLLRAVRRSRARQVEAAGDNVSSVTQLLLRTIAADGPMRASDLALGVHSDLSTVSRQVAALVASGLLERRADPVDGRACLLAVTDAAQATIAEHEQARAAFFARVLDGWDARDVDRFAVLLERFTSSYEMTHAAWMNELTEPKPVGVDEAGVRK